MIESGKVAIIDDEQASLFLAKKILKTFGYEVETFLSYPELRAKTHGEDLSLIYDLVISDVRMPRMSGLEVLKAIKKSDPETKVLLMTSFAGNEEALEAIELGAIDYIAKPFDNPKLFSLEVHKCIHSNFAVSKSKENIQGPNLKKINNRNDVVIDQFKSLSPLMNRAINIVNKVASTNVSILLNGETGVGKEVMANYIHQCSAKAGPFVAINCSAIPADLMESELFGHEKGSFTGADKQKIGLIEIAENGTLFLDEIGDLDMSSQTKLLRFLQERKIRRIGGDKEIDVNTRVISATHKDIDSLITQGKFREDLLYRLNTIRINIPALRERTEDILSISRNILNKLSLEYGFRDEISLSEEVSDWLCSYNWPGNIRELKGILERSFLLCEPNEKFSLNIYDKKKQIIGSEEIITTSELKDKNSNSAEEKLNSSSSFVLPLGLSLEEVEKMYLEETLKRNRNNKSQTAADLKIGLRTLYRKLDKYEEQGVDTSNQDH